MVSKMYSIQTPIGEIIHRSRGYVEIISERRSDSWINPLFVQILLTLKCNLMCPWCYANSSYIQTMQMDPDDAKEILVAVDKHVIGVSFGGGEPLTYKYIKDVLRFARERTELAISITTNGLLLINNLDILKYLDELRVSVYPYNYEFIKKHIDEMRRVTKKSGINFGINVMLFRGGLRWIYKVYRDFGKYIDDILITRFMDEGRGSRLHRLVPNNDDIERLSSLLLLMRGVEIKITGSLGDEVERHGIGMFKMGRESTVAVYPDLSISPSSITRNPSVVLNDPSEILMGYRMLITMGGYNL